MLHNPLHAGWIILPYTTFPTSSTTRFMRVGLFTKRRLFKRYFHYNPLHAGWIILPSEPLQFPTTRLVRVGLFYINSK